MRVTSLNQISAGHLITIPGIGDDTIWVVKLSRHSGIIGIESFTELVPHLNKIKKRFLKTSSNLPWRITSDFLRYTILRTSAS